MIFGIAVPMMVCHVLGRKRKDFEIPAEPRIRSREVRKKLKATAPTRRISRKPVGYSSVGDAFSERDNGLLSPSFSSFNQGPDGFSMLYNSELEVEIEMSPVAVPVVLSVILLPPSCLNTTDQRSIDI